MKHTELKRNTMLRAKSNKKRRTYNPWMLEEPKRNKKPKRSTYTKELREYIHERDGYCRVCGRQGNQVHHVVTRKRHQIHPERYTFADTHDERNLVWICTACHNRVHQDNELLEKVIDMQEQRFGPLRQPVHA